MNVAIIGHGFVGKALKNGLLNVETYIVDPKLKTKIEELSVFKPEIIFICVPTPMGKDGSQDISIAIDVIEKIKRLPFEPLIVMKSSVIPSKILYMDSIIDRFVYNPEFLREKHANEDFINSKLILFGGKKKDCEELGRFYDDHTKCKSNNYQLTDAISASLCKYTINSYLATKVIFFNEIKNIFDKSETDEKWSNFTKLVSMDTRIGDSHMDVPGHDGRRGFGGACFPKDTSALLTYSQELEAELGLLKKGININNLIRDEYNELTEREREQKVTFKLKGKGDD